MLTDSCSTLDEINK